MMEEKDEDAFSRNKRKEEAKLLKRKRIEEGGGVRPRQSEKNDAPKVETVAKKKKKLQTSNNTRHRFGHVMEKVPCRNKPRYSTLSIAIPGSVCANCQTKELKTHLVGQIARAASIYHVDEIIVFDDKLAKEQPRNGGFYSSKHKTRNRDQSRRHADNGGIDEQPKEREHSQRKPSDPHLFMARILQYCECPQYLRRDFFPMHSDLQFSGLLNPLDAPHHVRAEDRSPYREGIVLDKKSEKGNSMVNCGVRNRPIEIDRVLTPGIRCTVKIDVKAYGSALPLKGAVVSPSTPRETNGSYWGYSVRMAESLSHVFENCPFSEKGYDLKIGTSERGDCSVDDKNFQFKQDFRHALIVFGGVAGIEECVDADEQCKISGSQSNKLFDLWVNICPYQGSRTVRTEEAILMSLARFSPHFVAAACETNNTNDDSDDGSDGGKEKKKEQIKFSDNELSEESDCGSDA